MNDDLIARAEALMPMLDGCHDYANIQASEMVPELVAEVKRLTQLIDHTASNFLQLQPGIAWDGGIADAMKAAVEEIKRLRIENERAERAHESLDAMRKRQLAAKDAEICILKTEACAAQKNIERRDGDIDDLMTNCNQLRDRCWKAESELARWRDIATEQRALIQSIEKTEEYAYSKHVILSDRELEQAAKELGIQIIQEDEDLTTAYMLGSEKANKRLKVLQEYVKRLEAAYMEDSTQCEELAKANLEKIRHEM